jgi:hypothetical protein
MGKDYLMNRPPEQTHRNDCHQVSFVSPRGLSRPPCSINIAGAAWEGSSSTDCGRQESTQTNHDSPSNFATTSVISSSRLTPAVNRAKSS